MKIKNRKKNAFIELPVIRAPIHPSIQPSWLSSKKKKEKKKKIKSTYEEFYVNHWIQTRGGEEGGSLKYHMGMKTDHQGQETK